MEQCCKSALVVIIEQLYNDKTKLKDAATLELTKCAALGWVGPGLGPGFLGWCGSPSARLRCAEYAVRCMAKSLGFGQIDVWRC